MSKDTQLYEKAIKWVQNKGYDEIKVQGVDGFDDPISYSRNADDSNMTPDITAKRDGRRSYFEIAMKSDNQRSIVTKWRLLEQLAANKNGKFYILAPHGHKTFAKQIVDDYGMTAKVVSI